jgi:integrase
MPEYRIGRLNGRLCLTWWRDGKRHRYSLGTTSASEAERLAPALYAELTRPKGTTVEELWSAYVQDKEGRAVTGTMRYTWKALRDRFGPMEAHSVTVADCRAHIDARLRDGIKPGTIHTELGHLRMVLVWAEKQGLIDRAPHIKRPPKPRPRERHLTREQVRALFDNAHLPHIRLYGILAYTTAARNAALLGLTWDRCDFETGRIDLRDPTLSAPHKGRAIVPMLRTARAALQEARQGALTDWVIEWAGRPVKSVKRGLRVAAQRAGLEHVSPHDLRRSAAIHMAEDGVSISEISQYLGHSNERVTFQAYARFQPDHLRRAASALEFDDLAPQVRRDRSKI